MSLIDAASRLLIPYMAPMKYVVQGNFVENGFLFLQQTELHESAGEGHQERVKKCISGRADVNTKDNIGYTALHTSARGAHKHIVAVLIHHGADVNVKNTYGYTPLHISAWSGDTETVKLLIQHGANIDAVDGCDKTPLMWAEVYGHRHIVEILRQAKHERAGNAGRWGFLGSFFRYSSSTQEFSTRGSDNGSQVTKVTNENKEVRGQVTETINTSETGREGKGDDVQINRQSENQELVTQSAETLSYLTTSEADVCTSPRLSSELATSPKSASSSTSASASSPPTAKPTDEVTQYAQKLLKAAMSQRNFNEDSPNIPSEQLDRNVIVVEQKTENHYHNIYYNHCHNCNCINKQPTCEEIKVEKSESLNVSVGSAKYGLLYPPQGDDHEKEDDDKNMYRTDENREKEGEGRDRQTVAMKAAATTSTSSTTTCTCAAELRRRLESQAGHIEKMVQSCVAGGGVCQDQSSDLVPLPHGGLPVPVNLNFIYQPKQVEVWSAKQVNCEKADVETAEMMAVNSTCNFNYAAQKTSDDDDNGDSNDDDNSEDDKEIHIEDGED